MRNSSPDKILKALSTFVKFFQRHRIPYALIGAMTLNIYGRPRTTLDIDFLVLLDETDFINFKEIVTTEGIQIDDEWVKWNPMIAENQVRFTVENISVDVMLPRDYHDKRIFTRRRRKKVGNKMLWLIAPEDLIL
jgi:hypothetical protein